MSIDLVLVDFDDTLVDTAPRFQQARRELFRLLGEVGFAEEHARRVHHDEVDPRMREQFGLGPARLEHAFRATYESLCSGAAMPFEAVLAERAAALGRGVAGTPPLLNGALEALARLSAAFQTVLYTQAGDAEYQLRCVREAGVCDVLPLERVTVCERKTTDRFRQLLEDFGIEDASHVWMIGNSMRSDINPALEAGANAILVEVAEPWEFDLVEPWSDAYHRAATFGEAVDFLLGKKAPGCK